MIFHEIGTVLRQFGFSLESQLQNKISISVESLYYFKENQKGRKRSDRRIHFKIPAKTLRSAFSKAPETLACVRSRMNEVFQVERFLSSKMQFWSGITNM